jgi:hypothetical protein
MMRPVVIFTAAVAVIVTHGFASASVLGPPEAAPRDARPTETRSFILETAQTKIELGKTFLVPESDSVFVDGAPLARGTDYRINSLRGSIVLVRPAAGGERLVVRFSRYPLPFAPVFATHVAEGAAPLPLEALVSPVGGRRAPGAGEPYQLRLSGSKTVGINVGSSRDLGLDQSLRVTIAGKVAKDLEVSAFLTDDNLPVQPEGNTEELKYLDKVYVRVKAKRTEVQLGDFTTSLSWSRFSSFQRELRGVAADVHARGDSFFAGGGVAKGRFKTVRFAAQEGVQGPYELISARRFNAVIILPGTERVYCNGRALKRGSENDYVIDYSRGTVTFTERLPMTDDSEIVIDYEMSEDSYERSTVTGGWLSPRFGGVLGLRAFFFQEGDDTESPVFGTLTASDRAVLRDAGDDPSKSFTSGVENVEAGKGDYVLVPADSVPAHFEYASSGGDYRLEFYEAGALKGNYLVDGFTPRGYVKYRYAGEGKGDFRTGKLLPFAERKRLFTIGASAAKGSLYLDAEGDVSVHDRNLFSSDGDGDNTGEAMKIAGGLRGVKIPAALLSLSGEFSTLADRFTAPDKTRESYFYRDWGIEDIPLSGRESIGGARFGLTGLRAWTLGGSFLSLSRGSSLSARKMDVAGGLGDSERRGLAVKAFRSSTGGDRERSFIQGGGAFSFWRLVPRIVLETERYKALKVAAPDTGRHYRQGAFSVAAKDIGAYRGILSFTRRVTDDIDTTGARWFRSRENDEISLDAGFSGGGRIFELLATHRRSRDVQLDEVTRNNLARFRGRDSWEDAGIAADVSYRLSAGQERTREKAVVFVGENQGDYDREGREVGQKRGDYMLIFIPGGDLEPVRSVELSVQVSAGAGVRGLAGESRKSGLLGTLRREVSLDHFFSVLEKSRTGDLAGLYTLKPSLLQRNDLTVYGVNKLREECTIFNSSRIFKLRLSYSREDEEDNRIEGAFAEAFTRELKIRAESAPWDAFAIVWEAGTGLRKRDAVGLSEQRYRVQTSSLAQILQYRFNPSTRLSFELGAERRADEVSAAEQTSYTATPSIASSVGERLNVASFFKVTYTDVRSEAGKPLFFLEEGVREDWSAMGQYRFSRNVSFGLNYTGRREKNYLGEVKTVHDLKVESRAYF